MRALVEMTCSVFHVQRKVIQCLSALCNFCVICSPPTVPCFADAPCAAPLKVSLPHKGTATPTGNEQQSPVGNDCYCMK